MFASSPQNNAYLELLTTTEELASIPTLNGFTSGARTLDVILDVMILGSNQYFSDSTLFGQESFWWFYFDPVDSNIFQNLRFFTTRDTTTEASWDEDLEYGKRYIIHGRDNGDGLIIRVNGSAAHAVDATQADQGDLVPIAIDTEPITVGYDAVFRTQMRLYEAAVRVNGSLVVHIRPKLADGATVKDLTTFGNDLVVAGTEDTNYLYGPAWQPAHAFSGSDSLS